MINIKKKYGCSLAPSYFLHKGTPRSLEKKKASRYLKQARKDWVRILGERDCYSWSIVWQSQMKHISPFNKKKII